jgi:hypothetical protein
MNQATLQSTPVRDVVTRPILFSGPMVRAILDGRKTQTRRIVTDKHFKRLGLERDGEYIYTTEGPQWNGEFEGEFWSPFGQAGGRLWVRETHCQFGSRYIYRADYDQLTPISDGIGGPWKPAIHMPRKASRITLEVTSLRVERLSDISNADCVAEGITAIGNGVRMPDGSYAQAGRYETKSSTVRQLYSELWESINGPGSWARNPWVWVVEFRIF